MNTVNANAQTELEQLKAQLKLAHKQVAVLKEQIEVKDAQVTLLEAYKNETVWRLTVDDFVIELLNRYDEEFDEREYEFGKELTPEEEAMVDRAKQKFSIDDWRDWVEAFLDCYWADKK